MEGIDSTQISCTVCRKDIGPGNKFEFGGAPVCNECSDSLKLKDLDTSMQDDTLSGILDGQGENVIGEFLAIARTMPSNYGWNILAIMDSISKDLEEVQARALLESSTMICGLTVIRVGEGEGEVDPNLLSLFLVLGQVIDLSMMRRIVLEKGLRTSNKLDELILIGEHNRSFFDLITKIDHEGDARSEFILATCLERVV